ncbi:hypothetical protein COD67_04005 [Bacillus cereus]|nr:hypothetical protein COI89_22465 [Bacillus cereus]PGU69808.1 hypothetical protein COD67_04005 [Bacillus cereus]
MSRLLKLSFLDFRFMLKNKEVWISLFIATMYTFAIFFAYTNSMQSKNIDTYYSFYNDISFYIFIIIPAIALSREYSLKTSRIIFTGFYKKVEVILYKFLSILIFYIFLGILHRICGNLLWIFDQQKFSFDILFYKVASTIIIYIITGIFTCSIAFLITIITYSRMKTLIIMLALFIIEKYIRGVFLLLSSNKDLKILNHNPIAVTIESLQYGILSIMDSLILLFSSFAISIMTIVILMKKEIE